MEKDFWLNKWQANEIGFHRDEVNPHLINHFAGVKPRQTGHCFVPLCGKSNDLLFLAEQFDRVYGVELSELAVKEFFKSQQIHHQQESQNELNWYRSDPIQIAQGDYFKLKADHLPPLDFIYDRAALIAMPESMRSDYATHLKHFMTDETVLLLVSLSYPANEMQGPPFSVDQAEVERLFMSDCDVTLCAQLDQLDGNDNLRKKGLTQLIESVYCIKKRKANSE